MNLLLNIAGSDDRLSKEEDKLLNNTARALELDLSRFQQMKTSTMQILKPLKRVMKIVKKPYSIFLKI